MNRQADFAALADPLILTTIELYNWGGFNGRHRADMDPDGTAIVGATGSGKTTLVDALMTLLCANPRYNLASTGGHESDRDLSSYVRGVSGPGDGGSEQNHIARKGRTVTGIAARFENAEHSLRIGALLWFDGSGASAADMKKLWLYADDPEQTLDHWLEIHHAGGMRALRQLDKQRTGIWTYPSKKAFLARLRDRFDVGENAFTLLNRAAGLKQLNSIDEIFRELVLDDQSAFDRAQEVANSFDDLTDIREELEIAREQQRKLLPVAKLWKTFEKVNEDLERQFTLRQVLPIWYAEQASRLWQSSAERTTDLLETGRQTANVLEADRDRQRDVSDAHREAYLGAGGTNIEQLELRIRDNQLEQERRRQDADQYQKLTTALALDGALNAVSVENNQRVAEVRMAALKTDIEQADSRSLDIRSAERDAELRRSELGRELDEVRRRPDSNLPSAFQHFRSALAEVLGLTEAALPFVAELVQVKNDEQRWRGAIERAIGSHRLRILVPPEHIDAALRWINSRDNRLHVRLFEAKETVKSTTFFEDGFTRKLEFRAHPAREALKSLLAGIDRHCVDSPEALRHTTHGMTAEGLMSGQSRQFDKQDQKRLDADWMTGFDNRDRLAWLEQAVKEAESELATRAEQSSEARKALQVLQQESLMLERLGDIRFERIDVEGMERLLNDLGKQLAALVDPASDTARLKEQWDQALTELNRLEAESKAADKAVMRLEQQLELAERELASARTRIIDGLDDRQRALAEAHFTTITESNLPDIVNLERAQSGVLQTQIDTLVSRRTDVLTQLSQRMSDAKSVDRGALSEAGRELEDVPVYLERLRVLEEEALPEKRRRFLQYLNQSSDEGVTQLLSHVDNEVSMIEERIEDLNGTLKRVDFQRDRYLRLVSGKVVHESLRTLQRAQKELNAARFKDDDGESQYRALRHLVALLRDACERRRTVGARALLDPRYRLEFAVSVISREDDSLVETRTSSQGGSGGEKEIIASYVLTASLSYALCPAGASLPLFGTIVLDEAFSRSSQVVAGRIIAALREFGLHAVFVTPNKEMRLLRNHTRSAIIVHRRGQSSSLVSMSWQALENERHRPDGSAGMARRIASVAAPEDPAALSASGDPAVTGER
ncbi:ATP-binding protein [Granulosicoccus sp. 3-233]|uniref:ATP-binding protein n=1 Tax=Granulosicoccus sp. 3-233 TaxID=3417969 RepID=UPI003D32BBA9